MTNYKQYRADFAKAAWIAHMQDHGAEAAAVAAVRWADTFIAELERNEAQPAMPLLNTGWKWAEKGHVITRWDAWVDQCGRVVEDCGVCECDTLCIKPTGGLATPDWHNPENIAEPGEGYRFLVKGERPREGDDMFFLDGIWARDFDVSAQSKRNWTYRTAATRPLPPVLADE